MIRFLFLIFLTFPFLLPAQVDKWYGKWEVVAAPDSMASPEIVRSVQPYLGKKLVIKEGKFKSFFSREGNKPFTLERVKCKEFDYELEWQTAAQFLRFSGDPIAIFDRSAPDKIQVLSVSCMDEEAGATLYLLREDLILLSYLGLVCYLERR
ncbi:MAG: hypothetical protein GYB31_07945 [Bacteroidetes bacterium]|nr:hypothetical protein [Bacteroidota bacterium]